MRRITIKRVPTWHYRKMPLASNRPTIWRHCRHSDLGWAASPIRPDMIFGKDSSWNLPWKSEASASDRGIIGASGRRCYLHVQKFKWALDLSDGVDCHTCIAGGGRDITMAEKIMNTCMSTPSSRRWVAKLWRNM